MSIGDLHRSLEVKGARNGRKAAKHPVCSVICGSGGSKSRREGLHFGASDLHVFTEMILRDRRSTSYDLASLFRGRRSSLDRWTGQIAKRIGTRPSALYSAFNF